MKMMRVPRASKGPFQLSMFEWHRQHVAILATAIAPSVTSRDLKTRHMRPVLLLQFFLETKIAGWYDSSMLSFVCVCVHLYLYECG